MRSGRNRPKRRSLPGEGTRNLRVQGRQLGRPPRQLRERRGRPDRPAAPPTATDQVYAHRADDPGAASATNLGANTVRLPINPASVGTAWWKLLPRRHRRRRRPRASRSSSATGRPTRSKDGLIDDVAGLEHDVEHRRRRVPAQPARLLRADERAARLHARPVGRRHLRSGSPTTVRSRATASSSAAPATTTTSPASARRPQLEGHAAVAALLRLLGRRTRPRPTGRPTSRPHRHVRRAGRSSTRPVRP